MPRPPGSVSKRGRRLVIRLDSRSAARDEGMEVEEFTGDCVSPKYGTLRAGPP